MVRSRIHTRVKQQGPPAVGGPSLFRRGALQGPSCPPLAYPPLPPPLQSRESWAAIHQGTIDPFFEDEEYYQWKTWHRFLDKRDERRKHRRGQEFRARSGEAAWFWADEMRTRDVMYWQLVCVVSAGCMLILIYLLFAGVRRCTGWLQEM